MTHPDPPNTLTHTRALQQLPIICTPRICRQVMSHKSRSNPVINTRRWGSSAASHFDRKCSDRQPATNHTQSHPEGAIKVALSLPQEESLLCLASPQEQHVNVARMRAGEKERVVVCACVCVWKLCVRACVCGGGSQCNVRKINKDHAAL